MPCPDCSCCCYCCRCHCPCCRCLRCRCHCCRFHCFHSSVLGRWDPPLPSMLRWPVRLQYRNGNSMPLLGLHPVFGKNAGWLYIGLVGKGVSDLSRKYWVYIWNQSSMSPDPRIWNVPNVYFPRSVPWNAHIFKKLSLKIHSHFFADNFAELKYSI